jgi:hypothetical protein
MPNSIKSCAGKGLPHLGRYIEWGVFSSKYISYGEGFTNPLAKWKLSTKCRDYNLEDHLES